MRRSAPALLLVTALLLSGGCDDPFATEERAVPEEPGIVMLHDFSGGDVRDPSAFDALNARAVRTDLVSGWDFVFAIASAGDPELRPRSVVLGSDSEAGLQRLDVPFEDVETAPEDGYETEAPTPVEEGAVYAGVSRQNPGFQTQCRHFMKLEVLSLDPQDGSVEIRHLVNPNCELRNLVPGSGGSE